MDVDFRSLSILLLQPLREVISLIILSFFYEFPGKKNAIFDIETPTITYKIYLFRYCVTDGYNNADGVDKFQYGKDAYGCHLDLNPIGYVASTTNMQANPQDIKRFQSMATASFVLYYLGGHVVVLFVYLWWLSFIRVFNSDEKTPKNAFMRLKTGCLVATLYFAIPSILLIAAAKVVPSLANNSPATIKTNTGTNYLVFLNFLWGFYLITTGIVFLLWKREKRKQKEDIEKAPEEVMRGEEVEEQIEVEEVDQLPSAFADNYLRPEMDEDGFYTGKLPYSDRGYRYWHENN